MKGQVLASLEKYVAGVVGVVMREKKILLMHRSPEKTTNPGIWEAVAGKIELGEHPLETLEREVREECGLSVSISERPLWATQTFRGTEPMILLYYLCRNESGDVQLSVEHDSYQWVDSDKVGALCSFQDFLKAVEIANLHWASV